jgi:hypothetical protein
MNKDLLIAFIIVFSAIYIYFIWVIDYFARGAILFFSVLYGLITFGMAMAVFYNLRNKK